MLKAYKTAAELDAATASADITPLTLEDVERALTASGIASERLHEKCVAVIDRKKPGITCFFPVSGLPSITAMADNNDFYILFAENIAEFIENFLREVE